jgi:hypothetical protein
MLFAPRKPPDARFTDSLYFPSEYKA